MLASFSRLVIDALGRTVAVHPGRQIVERMLACVTAGLTAPGVQRGSGRAYAPDPIAWQEPAGGCRCTLLPLALE